jgi:hypothetical protein
MLLFIYINAIGFSISIIRQVADLTIRALHCGDIRKLQRDNCYSRRAPPVGEFLRGGEDDGVSRISAA